MYYIPTESGKRLLSAPQGVMGAFLKGLRNLSLFEKNLFQKIGNFNFARLQHSNEKGYEAKLTCVRKRCKLSHFLHCGTTEQNVKTLKNRKILEGANFERLYLDEERSDRKKSNAVDLRITSSFHRCKKSGGSIFGRAAQRSLHRKSGS